MYSVANYLGQKLTNTTTVTCTFISQKCARYPISTKITQFVSSLLLSHCLIKAFPFVGPITAAIAITYNSRQPTIHRLINRITKFIPFSAPLSEERDLNSKDYVAFAAQIALVLIPRSVALTNPVALSGLVALGMTYPTLKNVIKTTSSLWLARCCESALRNNEPVSINIFNTLFSSPHVLNALINRNINPWLLRTSTESFEDRAVRELLSNINPPFLGSKILQVASFETTLRLVRPLDSPIGKRRSILWNPSLKHGWKNDQFTEVQWIQLFHTCTPAHLDTLNEAKPVGQLNHLLLMSDFLTTLVNKNPISHGDLNRLIFFLEAKVALPAPWFLHNISDEQLEESKRRLNQVYQDKRVEALLDQARRHNRQPDHTYTPPSYFSLKPVIDFSRIIPKIAPPRIIDNDRSIVNLTALSFISLTTSTLVGGCSLLIKYLEKAITSSLTLQVTAVASGILVTRLLFSACFHGRNKLRKFYKKKYHDQLIDFTCAYYNNTLFPESWVANIILKNPTDPRLAALDRNKYLSNGTMLGETLAIRQEL